MLFLIFAYTCFSVYLSLASFSCAYIFEVCTDVIGYKLIEVIKIFIIKIFMLSDLLEYCNLYEVPQLNLIFEITLYVKICIGLVIHFYIDILMNYVKNINIY